MTFPLRRCRRNLLEARVIIDAHDHQVRIEREEAIQDLSAHIFQRLQAAGLSTEGRQMHQVALGNRLQRLAGFAPSCQSTYDDKRIESLLSE